MLDLISSAYAQTLTAVTDQNNGVPILLIGGLILAVGVIVLKIRRPDLFAKLTGSASKVRSDVEHTISGIDTKGAQNALAKLRGDFEDQLHQFEAKYGKPQQPVATAPTPTSPGIAPTPAPAYPATETLVPVPGIAPMTTEQFMGDAPLPKQAGTPTGPRMVNGKLVIG